MEATKLGRKPILIDGIPTSKHPPSRRGFTTITLRDEVFKRLQDYMKAHDIKTKAAAVDHLLTAVERNSSK
jgi:hypothetical protein